MAITVNFEELRRGATMGQNKALDKIDHPKHYTYGKYECSDVQREMVTKDSYVDHCILTVIKYVWRWRHKNGLEDLKKARWYLNKAIEVEEADESKAGT